MKIIITTPYEGANYGTRIQATALFTYLQNLGHEVFFMKDFCVTSFMLKHPSLLFSRMINRLTLHKRRKFWHPVPYSISDSRKERLDEFSRDNYKQIIINSKKKWKRIIENNAIFIVGSDILWQPANGYPSRYFLDFVYYSPLTRLAYGPSLGAQSLPKKYYRAYKKYLSGFKFIGMREQAAANLMSSIIDKEVYKVVDPSMLLTTDEWDSFANKAKISIPLEEKYVLCYFVMNDPKYWQYVAKATEQLGMQVVVLPMHSLDEEQPYTIVKDGTPYEFIYLIKNASVIITDSFHASVMSFLYNREFYTLTRTRIDENEKYRDLFQRYSLSSRFVTDETRFVRETNTDYSLGKRVFDNDRMESIRLINSFLVN